MAPIRILIADDHPVFRFGLKALLATETDFEVVGEAATGDEAVVLAAQLVPNMILMDINMPGLNGIEATQRISQAHPKIGILILSMLDDNTVFSAMRAGARGYLLKGSEGNATIRAIRVIVDGGTIFSPGVAERVIAYFSGGQRYPEPFPDLTEREREILALIAHGLTNQAIADRLALREKTVRNQVSIIYSKLQVASRGEVVAKAKDVGLGRPEQ